MLSEIDIALAAKFRFRKKARSQAQLGAIWQLRGNKRPGLEHGDGLLLRGTRGGELRTRLNLCRHNGLPRVIRRLGKFPSSRALIKTYDL
jgi:hypothetical protein